MAHSIFFWVQTFCCPLFLLVFIGFNTGHLNIFLFLLLTGVIPGIILAEYIRQRIGLTVFLP